jgi:hypothetical protein
MPRPGPSGGLRVAAGLSKRLVHFPSPQGGVTLEDVELAEARVLFLLLLVIFMDADRVSPDGRDVVAPRPEVPAREVLPLALVAAVRCESRSSPSGTR